MDIIKTKSDMQHWSKRHKMKSRTIAFVPTMGYLHQGHLSLMEKGKSLCDRVVASIFVNPTQFGPGEDLDSYPTDIKNDLALAEKVGVDAVFLPGKTEIYPENFQTEISLTRLPQYLCGRYRTSHFSGVALVVTKLFNIVMPDVAVFGQKDYQQLQIIRQLTRDLDFDIRIVGGKIVREADGLAMSSRNAYLSETERASALSLSKSLNLAVGLAEEGERNAGVITGKMETLIRRFEGTQIEYISCCDPQTLEDVEEIKEEALLALAVKVGKTRLIDNVLITL